MSIQNNGSGRCVRVSWYAGAQGGTLLWSNRRRTASIAWASTSPSMSRASSSGEPLKSASSSFRCVKQQTFDCLGQPELDYCMLFLGSTVFSCRGTYSKECCDDLTLQRNLGMAASVALAHGRQAQQLVFGDPIWDRRCGANACSV